MPVGVRFDAIASPLTGPNRSAEAFGVRVRKAEDAWEALKDSGADPHRLGQISQVLVAVQWGGGDSMTQSCPHCRQPLYLSFDGDGEA